MITNEYPFWLLPISQALKLKKIGYDLKSFFFVKKDNSGKFKKENLEMSYLPLNYNNDEYTVSIPTFEEFQVWFQKKGYLCSISYYNSLYFKKMDDENYSNIEYLGEVSFYVKLSKSVKGLVCKESERIDIESSYRLDATYGARSFKEARNIAVNELINFYIYDNKIK
jgi:hypothetical protein